MQEDTRLELKEQEMLEATVIADMLSALDEGECLCEVPAGICKMKANMPVSLAYEGQAGYTHGLLVGLKGYEADSVAICLVYAAEEIQEVRSDSLYGISIGVYSCPEYLWVQEQLERKRVDLLREDKKSPLYFWNYQKDDTVWYANEYTVAECIEQASKENTEGYKVVYIGKLLPYKPHITGELCVEKLEEAALDKVGECAEGWLEGITKTQKQELGKMLDDALYAWLENHDAVPAFGDFEWLKAYDLATKKELKIEKTK